MLPDFLFQLAFRATCGGEYSGDISLDKICIHPVSCSSLEDDIQDIAETLSSSSGVLNRAANLFI